MPRGSSFCFVIAVAIVFPQNKNILQALSPAIRQQLTGLFGRRGGVLQAFQACALIFSFAHNLIDNCKAGKASKSDFQSCFKYDLFHHYQVC
jgi:hypothetical protein